MKKITLVSLSIINFKGIKLLTVHAGESTNIFGRNASGKTTVADAWFWLLFGKDTANRSDFGIKPLSSEGKTTSQVETEVSAVLDINGQEITLKKIMRENWVKKRGSAVAEFAGNENLHYWNDVPLKVGEYQAKINELVDESIFKLITNPHHFNTSLKWQERRGILMTIAGDISHAELAEGNDSFQQLVAELTKYKNIDEYKKSIAAKKKKLKDDLDAIPSRVDELNRTMPELQDWSLIESTIRTKNTRIVEIDGILMDALKAANANNQERLNKQQGIFNLRNQIQTRENEIRNLYQNAKAERTNAAFTADSNISAVTRRIMSLKSELDTINGRLNDIPARKSALENQMQALRDRYAIEAAKVFEMDPHLMECPTCKRALEAGDIETKKAEMEGNFNQNKARNLAAINQEGISLKNQVASLEAQLQEYSSDRNRIGADIVELEQQLIKLNDERSELIAQNTLAGQNEIAAIQQQLDNDQQLYDFRKQIAAIESELQNPTEEQDNSVLKSEKATLVAEIAELNKSLGDRERIDQLNIRLDELRKDQKTKSQELADLEKTEFTIDAFNKAKIDTMEERINGLFKYASFKMFNTLGNGGVEECCETTYQGVPYSDLNTASKMLVGIDIINVLSQHFGVSAPIFLDNRESVSWIPDTDSQVINMIVSPKDEKLRIESKSMALAN